MATKHEVLREHLDAWLRAKGDNKRRSKIAQVVCEAIRMHPKSVSRAFYNLQMKEATGSPGRGRTAVYTPDVIAALATVWETGGYACAELLHPQIPEYVAVLKRDKMWKHSPEATDKLLEMSLGTLKRRVGVMNKRHGRAQGRSATKPSSLKSIIPIFKGPWTECEAGEGQLDTVAHCGDTLVGDFIHTVNYVDAPTYWTVPRAQWNKGQHATVGSIEAIRERVPFPLKMLHPDSGSEFINWVAKLWCESQGIELTRSEPNRKNDNMFVEERNGHVVRRYLKYGRLDKPELVPLINELYDVLCLYTNHFKAVRRQTEKVRIGSTYVRRYEPVAKTPYQRVLERHDVSQDVKQALREQHDTLNPLVIKIKIDTMV
jgi:hypothetical protein